MGISASLGVKLSMCLYIVHVQIPGPIWMEDTTLQNKPGLGSDLGARETVESVWRRHPKQQSSSILMMSTQ